MTFRKKYKKPYTQPPPSPIEICFWEAAKPLIPELEKEVWIGKYRVDFLISSKKVVIELYGYQHHNTKAKITEDAERERYLQRAGFQVIRFTGTEIYKDVAKCVNEVLLLAKIRPAKTSVNPIQLTAKSDNSSSVIATPEASQYTLRYKQKMFGMKNWQVIILVMLLMTLLCILLCFVSMLVNSRVL